MTNIAIPTQQPYVLEIGQGEKYHFLNNLAVTKVTAGDTGSMSAVEFLAPHGFGPPAHTHRNEDELFVIIDGEIAFHAGDEETFATAGALAFLPHGIPHTFQVHSETARMICVTAAVGERPTFDRMVAALGEPTQDDGLRPPIEIDAGRVALVNADYGIDIVGPPPTPLS